MRRLFLVCLTVFLSAGLALFATLSVNAQTASQYDSSGGEAPESRNIPPPQGGAAATQVTQAAQATQDEVAEAPVPVAEAPESVLLPQGTPSQGSVVEGPGVPEEDFPAYSQVVDNGSRGLFKAQGWGTASSGPGLYGEDYGVARAAKGTKSAQFKVRIPATDTYSVYAWWPAGKGNDPAARYGVRTTSGVEWTQVNQRRDGGLWVLLGEYEMARGDRYAVQVAPGSRGRAVADAVAVVRGVQSAPPAAPGEAATRPAGDGETITATRAGGHTGADVVRQARRYLGTKYAWGECTSTRMSCTCLTKKALAPFGVTLPMTENGQWKAEPARYVAKSDLRPGDEVFFKENGPSGGITHVGIYAGRGYIVHASAFAGAVTDKTQMKYIKGYFGAKRYTLR